MRGNMKAERNRLGLTLEEASEAIGVHVNALTRWENGKAEPMGSSLVSLAKLYGCSPEYLLEQTDDPHGRKVASE
jgi:transcriptional regulator with XRE-family HTH domain